MAVAKQSKLSSMLKGRKGWFALAVGCGVIAVILLATLLSTIVSTTKYYVLKQDVPARTLVTADMLKEVVTTTGGQPQTALTPADLNSREYYTKVDLQSGDIVTDTNAGDLIPLTAGIPSNYVVGSFSVDPNNAAAGQIKRGDYIDIYLSEDDTSNLVLQRVLVLQAQQNLDEANANTDSSVTSTADTPTAQYNVGIPYLYTVGVSPEDAAKIALLSSKGDGLFVTLSSSDSVQNGAKETTIGSSLTGLLNSPVGDSGKGTDNTFSSTQDATENSSSSSSASPSANASSSPSANSSSATTDTSKEDSSSGE